MKGRKPKPIEQKRREGNPGKRKLPSRARQVKVLGPGTVNDWDPPETLRAVGRKHWMTVVIPLHEARLIDIADRAFLELMCECWQRIDGARRMIDRAGLMSRGSTGQIREHPAVGIIRAESVLYLRYAEQVGSTPAARARLQVAGGGIVDPPADLEREIGSSPRFHLVS